MVDYRLENIIAKSTVIEAGPPVVYQIHARPLDLKKSNIAKVEFGIPVVPHKPTRVLMVVGATGAGKSTLINAMVNFLLGVKWEHEFRLKLIHDEVSQSQAHSQTQMITAYTFYWQKGSPLNCNLTIIDTPGFGDTRGLKRDQEITRHIREFFELKGRDGLDSLHGIGFVTQASLARLTPTQKYISDSILSIFGKDIKDNIFIMTTFADGADPPVMGAIREANIPHASFFPFNNSALFAHSDGVVSLQMTREVLHERQQLETIVNGIQPKINAGLAKIDELKQEEEMLKANESKILANKDFKYKVKVTKQRQIPLPHGQYVTNCVYCSITCHNDCIYGNDKDKWKCCAMSGNESNATCKVCVNHCSWEKHFNNGYIFEFYEEMETRTSQELYERYTEAKTAKDKLEYIIQEIEKELQEMQRVVLYNIRKARKCLQRLDEIALKPNPLTEVEYIDLLIKSEEQQKNAGWEKRIDYFYEVRQQAELLATVTDEEAFEKLACE
uniref:Septin-type G domain-containing protein n=1 Tax=Amphimedon queenslandica TaxID=400682 RepID=A0A1X7T458_AMPQE